MTLTLRPIAPQDIAACIDIYTDAIWNGTAPHYSKAQRMAWAPPDAARDIAAWTTRLGTGTGVLASVGDKSLGFIVITDAGYLDLFFVRPEARGDGTAAALYNHALKAARAGGAARLTTHASHLARAFLERREWVVLSHETVKRNGVSLDRFAMELLPKPG